MSDFSLDLYWERVESQFQRASVALADGNSQALSEHSASLQQLAVDLLDYLNRGGAVAPVTPALRQRMVQLATLMPALRDALYRRTAYADLALQTLVPAAPEATYGGDRARPGAAVYGTIPRQSGSLRTVAA